MKRDGVVYFSLAVIILILTLFNFTEGNRHARTQDIVTELKAEIAELHEALEAHDAILKQHNKDMLWWQGIPTTQEKEK